MLFQSKHEEQFQKLHFFSVYNRDFERNNPLTDEFGHVSKAPSSSAIGID